ncbi:hypothetical protein H2248_000031 [Termitomyces sp. 'cryptogamus']|nr:hypothetical protein H2248_000031 [Termitomyces sp. 'cryptogamus']
MTEYDYSPEAYERYLATQQRISRWVATTEGYRNEYGNALTVPPSEAGSQTQPRGQLLSPVETPLRSSQSQYFHPQNPPRSQSRLASSCQQRSAVDLHSQYLQHSSSNTSPRYSAPFVPPQAQRPRTVSRHESSTNLQKAASGHRDANTSRTSSTYVAAMHPSKPLVSSQHASIVPEIHGQHLQDANVAQASQRSLRSASSLQKAPLRHHASTPQLEIASRQAQPTYMLTIPPSDKPTYVYAPSGWVPSAGLVIVPSKGQGTSIVISPPSIPQVQPGYTQPVAPTAMNPCSPLTTPQTTPHASSPTIYPPTTYVPVPVVIIERERRSKSAGGKKSKKKDKRNRSKARS